MRSRHCLAFTVALASVTAALCSQSDYRWEQNDAVGVRFQVFKKLFPVPLKLGESDPSERAKFEPKDQGDYIHGRLGTYNWGLYLVEFPKKKEPAKTGGGAPSPEEEVRRPTATSFQQWVTDSDRTSQDRKFVKKAVPIKGKGKNLDCKWWEYTDTQKVNTGVKGKDEALVWYHCAASFDLPEREVALWCIVPVKRGNEADPTYMKWMETMCQSLQPVEVSEATSEADVKRDEFANTPERKAELDKAKANIANLKGWGYFTMPDYIVLHSWDPKKDTPEQRKESTRFARDLVGKLEDVRELYIKEFPPHEKMKANYPVLRICNSYEEFQKYGDSPRGVVGWFSPHTKELVVFNDTEHILGSKDVFTTVRHEGWHQYADSYFGGVTEKGELHRWYDEGLGDYFGSFNKTGNTWSYTADKGRHAGIRMQLSRKNYVPLREIVGWNKDKFYGERAVDYYAEGYSLVDFLRRGPEVLGKRFDERWAKVMDIYRSTMLETHDQKKAVEAAFAGIDWDQFQAAWEDWVRNSMK